MSYATAKPYIASYVLLEKYGKFAFVLREHTSWMNDYYGLPSGKVEEGEEFSQAAIREAREEVGVTIRPEHLHAALVCHRREPDEPDMTWVDVVFRVSEWEGEVVNAEPHKHSAVAWFSIEKLPNNTIPAVRFMLEQIKAGETYCEYGWQA